MTKESWRIAWIITGIGMLSVLIGFRFATGWLLGCLTAMLLYKRIERFWTGVLDSGHSSAGTGYSHYLLNYGIMAGVMIICARLPDYLNIFTCALGLMLIKFTSLVEVFISDKKGGDK